MKYKISSLLIALLMLVSVLPSAALAENTPWMGPHSLHGTVLERSVICATENGHEDYFYDPSSFSEKGWIGGIRVDLDNDDYTEELHIKLDDDNFIMIVYDEIDGNFQESARTSLFPNNIRGNIQANDVFLKHNGERWFIFCESWYQENAFADGAAWTVDAYYYEANRFMPVTEIRADGTDIYGTLDDWRNDESIAEYRADLPLIAAALDVHEFDVENVYWGNMICEQDSSLTVLARIMAVQDVPVSEVVRFSTERDEVLHGFRAMLIDCSVYDYTLPEEYYLSNNQPPHEDNGAIVPIESSSADGE